MSNVLEFYLKMKDMMSSGLANVAKTSKSSMAQVEKDVRKVRNEVEQATVAVKKTTSAVQWYGTTSQSAMHRATTSTAQATKANKDLAKSLDDVNKKAKESHSSVAAKDSPGSGGMGGAGLFGKFKGAALGAAIGAAALAAAIPFATASAQQYMQFEANNKSYEVLAGNKGVGRALAGELNQLKQDTILGPAVYQNAKTMMGFGIGAEKVIGNLKMLGEVSMGDADRLERLTLAFSQTQAAGKLMGQDLLQYINAGFNPLNEISKMTGKSIGLLRKEMEEGKISSQMVTQAFERATSKGGLFYGMLDQMSQTASGKMAAMHGKVAALQIAIGERLAPAMNTALDATTKLVVQMKKWIEVSPVQKIDDEIAKLRGLQIEMTAANTTHERRLQILRELENINPNTVKGISDQAIEYGKLAQNINNVTTALQNKKIVELINDKNSGLLANYALYKEKADADLTNIYTTMGRIGDNRLTDDKLTFGQKQQLAEKILMERVRKQGNQLVATEDAKLLGDLRASIGDYNRSQGFLQYNKPKVDAVQKQIGAATKIFEQVLGVKSMTAAAIGNGGGADKSGTTTTTTTADAVGRGVASAGPRQININGVKFADNIHIHADTVKEGINDMEKQLEEMYLRLLNSGANVQS